VSDQGRLSGWRLNVLRVLALAAVIAITAYIYACRSQLEHLEVYGYPGIFLLSILANATVILPAPGIAITFALGAVFNPIGVALAAGAGATLGELTGYVVGLSGQGFAERTDLYDRLERWTERYGGLFIFVLSLVPNPFCSQVPLVDLDWEDTKDARYRLRRWCLRRLAPASTRNVTVSKATARPSFMSGRIPYIHIVHLSGVDPTISHLHDTLDARPGD
jgi:membrane protein YqaA with SNARE-associated domain